MGGHAGIGENAAISDNTLLDVAGDVATTAYVAAGISVLSFKAAVTGSYTGLGSTIRGGYFTTTYEAAPSIPSATAVGIRCDAIQGSTSALSALTGIEAQIKTAVGSVGGVSTAIGLNVIGTFSGAKPTDVTGINIPNIGTPGITNATGIKVSRQVGATNNYGLWLAGNSSVANYGSALFFGLGKDAAIYYDIADLNIDTAAVGTGVLKFANATNWAANSAGVPTLGTLPAASTGAGNNAQWLTVKDNNGVVHYIPAWT